MNGTLKSRMAKMCAATNLKWPDALPLVLISMRNTPNKKTGLSPHEIPMGRPARLPAVPENALVNITDDMVLDYCKGLADVVRSFSHQVEATTLPLINDPGHNLKAGDWVFINVRKSCLEPRWKGPYQVILTTTTAVKCVGIPNWIHASHTKKITSPTDEEVELLKVPTTEKEVSGPESDRRGTETEGEPVEDGLVTPVRDKEEETQRGDGEPISTEAPGEPNQREVLPEVDEYGNELECWKHAEVNALLKKPTADPSDLKNFRPISLLPFPAKVIEKTVNKQLTTFLEDNNLLDPSQTGFRTNHSTETALISVTDDIRTLMDNGETVAFILLDLSAAFDTVCHRTLITRLRSTGIQGQALDWIASFLSNRSQRVYLPPFRSEPTEIICGVPQGSSLSPTFFNVYMSPLANIVRKHDIIITSYADDTQLILSLTKEPASAKTNLQEGMKEVADWMRLSRLKLNSEKTEVLILFNTPSA
ncbi:hypothetical protein NDU88_000117 [Pleurodeles waltl]|uniref:ribonuclease H n=1 Tax=Pleurodeles waltl TaxID=8319 RepID=A0AAV7S7A2_PLEWA|nr:hypothetical protein NDU88_000117 [Pleurodeles waltl]